MCFSNCQSRTSLHKMGLRIRTSSRSFIVWCHDYGKRVESRIGLANHRHCARELSYLDLHELPKWSKDCLLYGCVDDHIYTSLRICLGIDLYQKRGHAKDVESKSCSLLGLEVRWTCAVILRSASRPVVPVNKIVPVNKPKVNESSVCILIPALISIPSSD